MSIFGRFFNRRQAVPSTDSDIEAQVPSQPSAIELSRPSTRDEDGLVIVDQRAIAGVSSFASSDTAGQTEGSASSATANSSQGTGDDARTEATMEDTNHFAVNMINSRLKLIRNTGQIMIFFTVLQIMATLGTERIHFLSLFSLFVPWTGYEGAKERNFGYLRAFYWGCWVMIPANFFHYLSFEQVVVDSLSTNIADNLKQELLFNQTLFNIVTVLIILMMTFSLVWIRQMSFIMRTINLGTDYPPDGIRREGPSTPTGPLSSDEISAIAAFKLSNEHISPESGEKDVCVICQDDFQANDLAKRLNCRHMFHAHCIDAWLERSNSCPICNGDVRSIV